ncbi:MAG TPA: energy transducer TonB [Dongiaceae bacterium]|nr:energy transducer TonB [Dongiaceae bacterium]
MNVPRERARNFLVYGFAISLAVHAFVLPFVHVPRPAQDEERKPDVIDISDMPTPPPTAPPSPTPKPTVPPTPPPHAISHTAAPQRHAIRINAPHADARAGGIGEPPNRHVSGDVNGTPDAPGTAAPVAGDATATSAPATPVPTPAPRPTPTPLSCARPNVPATTLRALEPDTPPLAAQQGISGTVQVVVSLDAQSRIAGTRIQTSPSAVLNAAALAAARGSQFRTEVRNCEPVAADYIFSVDFTSQ